MSSRSAKALINRQKDICYKLEILRERAVVGCALRSQGQSLPFQSRRKQHIEKLNNLTVVKQGVIRRDKVASQGSTDWKRKPFGRHALHF